ncbi:LysM peptidoglycan-binding domain-containing protein [Herbiconiux sp. P15]|uniref:LysM peptidoglycan-binding domain-containing protein n=1 Tax=Herbiconiux liukaitaii TaxID=3342799 RepID=UPI0035B8265C
MSYAAAPLSTTTARTGAASTGTASAVPTTRLRITARGRTVLASVIALPIILLLGFAALFSGGTAVATGTTSGAEFDYLTVKSGQSLWAIAESLAPEADPRDVIAEIMSLNQLSESSVQPGQRIAVPADIAD